MADLIYGWSEEKNTLLKTSIGIYFEDIIVALQAGQLLSDEPHFNQDKYPNQRLYIVEINSYAYVVPYVVDDGRGILFLKTIYPSRKHTKLFLSRKNHD